MGEHKTKGTADMPDSITLNHQIYRKYNEKAYKNIKIKIKNNF